MQPVQHPLPRPQAGDERESAVDAHSFLFPPFLERMPYELAQGVDFYSSEMSDEEANGARKVELPIFFRVEVFPTAVEAECMLIATANRRPHGDGGDGMTVYASVSRTDFTFRGQVYDTFPNDVLEHNQCTLRRGEWNELAWLLSRERSTYWINGQRVATCYFEPDDLPNGDVFMGVAAYELNYRVRNCDASRDPTVLRLLSDRVLTLAAHVDDAGCWLSCTALDGTEVARLRSATATELVGGTDVIVHQAVWSMAVTYDTDLECWLYVDQETDEESSSSHPSMEGFPEDAQLLQLDVGLRGKVINTPDSTMIFMEVPSLKEGTVAIRVRDKSALKCACHEERLADLRPRIAAGLGCIPRELRLVLADGTFLAAEDDLRPIARVFGLESSSGSGGSVT